VSSQPQLAAQDETQADISGLARWETVGPIDTTHTQPIQTVRFETDSGSSTPPEDPGTPVRRGRFAVTRTTLSPPPGSPPPQPPVAAAGEQADAADVESTPLYRELLARQAQHMSELVRSQEEERLLLREDLLDQWRREHVPPDHG